MKPSLKVVLGRNEPQRLHHVASRGHFELVRFEDQTQSSKNCFVIIHEQQSYGSQGVTPLVPVAHRQSGPAEYPRRDEVLPILRIVGSCSQTTPLCAPAHLQIQVTLPKLW